MGDRLVKGWFGREALVRELPVGQVHHRSVHSTHLLQQCGERRPPGLPLHRVAEQLRQPLAGDPGGPDVGHAEGHADGEGRQDDITIPLRSSSEEQLHPRGIEASSQRSGVCGIATGGRATGSGITPSVEEARPLAATDDGPWGVVPAHATGSAATRTPTTASSTREDLMPHGTSSPPQAFHAPWDDGPDALSAMSTGGTSPRSVSRVSRLAAT